jgi:hypothetical protein
MTNLLRVKCLTVLIGLLYPAFAAAQQADTTLAPARGGQRGARLSMAERANMPAPQGFSVVLVLGEMQGPVAADNVPPAARKALADMKDFLPYKAYKLLDTQWTLCCGHSAIVTRLRGDEQDYYDLELEPNRTDTSGKWYVRFSLRNAATGGTLGAAQPQLDETRQAMLTAKRQELENQLRNLKQRYNDNHPEVQKVRTQLVEVQREESELRVENAKRRAMIRPAARTVIDTSFTMDIGETVVVGTSRLQGDKALIALLTAVASTKPATTR